MYLCARMHARAAEGEGDGKHERPGMRCFLKAWLGTCRKHASWERAFATCARASPALSAERSSKTILVSVSYCVQLTAITWTGMNRTYVTFPVKATAGLTVRSWVIQEAKVYSHFLKDEYRGGGEEKKSFIVVTYIYIYSSNPSAGWWFWNIFSLLRHIRVQPAYYKWLSGPKVILYWTEASSFATISCKKLESDLISLLISLSVFTFVLKIARKNNKEVRKSW